jgi:hypothetical protein
VQAAVMQVTIKDNNMRDIADAKTIMKTGSMSFICGEGVLFGFGRERGK